MKILKVTVDKKTNHCIACPISKLHICGKENIVQATSVAVYVEMIPCSRCKLREDKQ